MMSNVEPFVVHRKNKTEDARVIDFFQHRDREIFGGVDFLKHQDEEIFSQGE